jgi:lysophospholipase L1-like esterase
VAASGCAIPGADTLIRKPARPVGVVVVALAGVLAAVTFASCAPVSSPAAVVSSPTAGPCPASTREPTSCILVLGDSIASGEGAAGSDRWPARLETLLRTDFPGRTVIVSNLAQAGSQVELLERQIAELPLEPYDVAIVISGVNDTSTRQIEQWAPRYAKVIDALEAAGLTVVIGTAPPTLEGGAFTDRYAQVAEELRTIAGGRPMLDLAKDWLDLGVDTAGAYYADDIHQNAAGQAVIAEKARPIVGAILQGIVDAP